MCPRSRSSTPCRQQLSGPAIEHSSRDRRLSRRHRRCSRPSCLAPRPHRRRRHCRARWPAASIAARLRLSSRRLSRPRQVDRCGRARHRRASISVCARRAPTATSAFESPRRASLCARARRRSAPSGPAGGAKVCRCWAVVTSRMLCNERGAVDAAQRSFERSATSNAHAYAKCSDCVVRGRRSVPAASSCSCGGAVGDLQRRVTICPVSDCGEVRRAQNRLSKVTCAVLSELGRSQESIVRGRIIARARPRRRRSWCRHRARRSSGGRRPTRRRVLPRRAR